MFFIKFSQLVTEEVWGDVDIIIGVLICLS